MRALRYKVILLALAAVSIFTGCSHTTTSGDGAYTKTTRLPFDQIFPVD